ncbi:MAG: hypothetical protein GY847_34010 [Proteobacteria bacterium]|nr:hypothetical protein [Pseudomonadota bacterium]
MLKLWILNSEGYFVGDILKGIGWLIAKIFAGLLWLIEGVFGLIFGFIAWVWDLPWYVIVVFAVLVLAVYGWASRKPRKKKKREPRRVKPMHNSKDVNKDDPSSISAIREVSRGHYPQKRGKSRLTMVRNNLMKQQKDTRTGIFIVSMGMIALLADTITIGNFVITKNFMRDVWSPEWILSIFLILALMFFGLWLILVGGQERLASAVAKIFGLLYLSLGILLYSAICFQLLVNDGPPTEESLKLRHAFWFMFWVAGSLGVLSSLKLAGGRFVREASCALCLVNVLFALAMVHSYTAAGKKVVGANLMAESIAFLVGAGLTFALFLLASDSESSPREVAASPARGKGARAQQPSGEDPELEPQASTHLSE